MPIFVSAIPNRRIVERPIWSTRARYKNHIKGSIVLNYTKEILKKGYKANRLEIDDWESCRGSLTPKNETSAYYKTIQKNGFIVTLRTHPFINAKCTEYGISLANMYFVNDKGGVVTNRRGSSSQFIDFTKAEAKTWFFNRLKELQHELGINKFTFDIGETTWAPQTPLLFGNVDFAPNSLIQAFLEEVARFGYFSDVGVGFRSQHLGLLTRMPNKNSTWGVDGGLKTLIPTLLQMNMYGYTM